MEINFTLLGPTALKNLLVTIGTWSSLVMVSMIKVFKICQRSEAIAVKYSIWKWGHFQVVQFEYPVCNILININVRQNKGFSTKITSMLNKVQNMPNRS